MDFTENNVFTDGDPLYVNFCIKTINGYKKYIGVFKRSDRVFRKDIQAQHKFQKADCLGVDVGCLEHLDRLKCEKVIFKETATSNYYSIPYAVFLTKGFQYPRECNTKAKGRFQPSYMCNKKWFRIRDKHGNIIKESEYEQNVDQSPEE